MSIQQNIQTTLLKYELNLTENFRNAIFQKIDGKSNKGHLSEFFHKHFHNKVCHKIFETFSANSWKIFVVLRLKIQCQTGTNIFDSGNGSVVIVITVQYDFSRSNTALYDTALALKR